MKSQYDKPDLDTMEVHPVDPREFIKGSCAFPENTFLIGFDSEYVPNHLGDRKKNLVLSYQTYTIVWSPNGPIAKWFWAADVEHKERLKLGEVIRETLLSGKERGLFRQWPEQIILLAHYSLAEMTSLKDFAELKVQFDGVRKSYISLTESWIFDIYDDCRNKHIVDVTLRDTNLLAPAKAGSLDHLGKTIGLPKIEISFNNKKDFRKLKAEQPALYWKYAMRDAEVSALYYLRICIAAKEMLGRSVDPVTLGGLAPRLVFKIWEDLEIIADDVLGREEKEVSKLGIWGRYSKMEMVDLPKKAEFNPTAAKGYMGGRNEAYYYGQSPKGRWLDLDLRGAYVTAMGALGTPKWTDLRLVELIEELEPECMGVAHVRFSFPPSVRFPCIPVQLDSTLIFPRTGSCWATSPEIWLARKLGAEVELTGRQNEKTAIGGFVLPMDFSCRPFLEVARYIQQKRAEYRERDPMLAELYKQIGNSVYGKTAQAIREKMVFNTRRGKTEPLEPSSITNYYIALHTTGLVRAVLSEILNAIPEEFIVISATTDGFLTNFPEERMADLCTGRIASIFAEVQRSLSGSPAILEVKHRPERVVSFRTRGQATVTEDGDYVPLEIDPKELVLARGGIKTAERQVSQANNAVVMMFRNREPGQKYIVEGLRGFRAIYDADGSEDLNSVIKKIGYRMDFDWKRMPRNFGENELAGQSHLWFDTLPLESQEQYEKLREGWKNFYKTGRVLKTQADLCDFVDYMSIASPLVRKKGRGKDVLATAKKAYLRAYTQEAWGIERHFSNKELADQLSAAGYPTTVHEVENNARRSAKLLEKCLPRTPEVMEFLRAVVIISPQFPIEYLLA